MEEITKIDTSMYYVLKTADVLKFCNNKEISQLGDIAFKIENERKKAGKEPRNEYLVLNMNDSLDKNYLMRKMSVVREQLRFKKEPPKIKNIAHHIVNAILNLQTDAQK